jgi:hypothetical protein
MRAGRLCLWSLVLLAGCDHLEPLRQGLHSTYNKELRQLAEETNRQELARMAEREETAAAKKEVVPAGEWHAAPLSSAVQLKAPVPFGVRDEPYPDEPR